MDDYDLIEYEDHIYVKFSGKITSEVITHIIDAVMGLDTYAVKNDVYDFREAETYFDLSTLDDVVDGVKKKYPAGATRAKSAFIVDTETNKAIVKLFQEAAKDLPFEIEIFDDVESAVNWVRS